MKPFQAPRLKSLIDYLRKHRLGLSSIVILGIAIFFRFWQLWKLPPGLSSQEAANGLTIVNGSISADVNHFISLHWQSLFVKIFGNTTFALRFGIAIIGLATITVTYLWLKQWFSKRAALATCFFMASGTWAVGVSRLGLSATMLVFIIILNAWLLSLALKNKRWLVSLVSGMFLAAGLYIDTNYQYALLAIVVVLIYCAICQRGLLKKVRKQLLAILVVFLLFLTPWLMHALGDSKVLITSQVVTSQPNQLVTNAGNAVALFNFSGDKDWQYNLAATPQLNFLVGVFFLLGLMLSIRRSKDLRYFSLLAVFGCMMIPVLVGADTGQSLSGASLISVVYVLAAIGLVELVARWHGVFPRNPAAYWSILAIVILSVGLSLIYDYKRYFVAWSNSPQTYAAFNPESEAAANYIKAHPSNTYRVLLNSEQKPVLQYLVNDRANYQLISTAELGSLGKDALIINLGKPSANLLNNYKLILDKRSQKVLNVPLFQLYKIGGKT